MVTTGIQIFLRYSQDFGDISVVLKMAHFRKSTGPRWVNSLSPSDAYMRQ